MTMSVPLVGYGSGMGDAAQVAGERRCDTPKKSTVWFLVAGPELTLPFQNDLAWTMWL